MRRYIIRRLLIAIVILFGVSVVTFTFASLAPGDPVQSMVRPGSDVKPGDLENLKKHLGLDQPWHVRYLTWASQILQGNLGVSYISGQPISRLLGDRIPNSLKLMGTALVVSLFLGVALGVYSAFRQGSRIDNILTMIVFAGISLPSYLIALLAVLVFPVLPYTLAGVKLFPATGIQDPTSTLPPFIDFLWHLFLPAAVLAFAGTATFLRYTRASVLEVMRQDHVTTARSKGLGEQQVRARHVLRNALLPVVTVLGLSLPSLITGALFVETLFTWPGVGSLAIDATMRRDYPLILAIALVTSITIILSNLVTDIAYAYVDPRIRYS